MINTVIVVPSGEILPDGVVSAYFFLSQANQYRASINKPPIFDLSIGGRKKSNWLYDGHFGIRAKPLKDLSPVVDLIVVPGFIGTEIPLESNGWLIEWLQTEYERQGAEVASMCTGAFLLAAAGLLDGKVCTTHWAYAASFEESFPEARLVVDRIVTDAGGIYTSGGAFSSLNLLLYLVEKFGDKETAIWLSKAFQVDLQRRSQRPFMILNQLYDHKDETIKAVQQYVEHNFEHEILLTDLAREFALSPRSLLRRFRRATGLTPLGFVQQVRVEAAKRLLEDSDERINEIVFRSGYNDAPSFRRIFKRQTGLTPREYRNRYGLTQNR